MKTETRHTMFLTEGKFADSRMGGRYVTFKAHISEGDYARLMQTAGNAGQVEFIIPPAPPTAREKAEEVLKKYENCSPVVYGDMVKELTDVIKGLLKC